MSARIAYFRVSTADQSIQAQRTALGGHFDKEFSDEGISGAVAAALRPGFASLMAYAREGDSVHVYAVDRLGRDALDVQSTVRALLDRGVAVEIHNLGRIARGVGELILAVLAQVADMERRRIVERTALGRIAAQEALAKTGKTHRGKTSLGRPMKADPATVKAWREGFGDQGARASIAQTALHFGLSCATVKRYLAST